MLPPPRSLLGSESGSGTKWYLIWVMVGVPQDLGNSQGMLGCSAFKAHSQGMLGVLAAMGSPSVILIC
ncbi:hypothetical protein Tco_0287081 [Tanacetum coccineum]